MSHNILAHHGDVFEVEAECLICSANVFLTLSGGVGGELLRRYGVAAQQPLVEYLERMKLRFTKQGDVVQTRPMLTPYQLILHAVAVDGMYDSSPSVIGEVVAKSLCMASEAGCRTVAMPALATGYGHLAFTDFLAGWIRAVSKYANRFDLVMLVLRDPENVRIALEAISGHHDI